MAKKRTSGRRDNRTGAIYKDGSGYRVQILIGHDTATGKPIYKKVRAKTHDEAVDALAGLQQSNRQGRLAAPSGLTLGKYLEYWLENKIKTTRAPNTYRQYKCVLDTHVIPSLGKKALDKVRRPDVQELVTALTAQAVKPKWKEKPPKKRKTKDETEPKPETPKLPSKLLSRRTIEVVVQRLHTAYEDAIRDGLAAINPAEYISLPAASKKPPQFLTAEQILKLEANLGDSPIRELTRFMLVTGTRLGEATGVRWKDIDFTNRIVKISGQLQRVASKLEYRPVTKTNQDRPIAIPEWLSEELKSMRGNQILHGFTDPDDIAFLNEFGRRFDGKRVYNELAAVCISAKVPVVSPHKLRHSFATLALLETGDLHRVSKTLGHAKVSLTSDLYSHAMAELTRTVTDALGQIMRPTQPKAKE